MDTDLWSEASRDIVVERRARDLEMAKAASQGTWEFLALAQSPEEYGDRVALAADQITATASASGVEVADLVGVFDSRFALLMEAKGNPFGNDDSDDDSDDSGSSDDDSDDGSDDDSDSDDGDGDDDSDDSSSDGDDDSSSDDSGDSPDDSDGGDSSAPPWANKFSSLHAAIQQGSNPLEWGGAPFVRSSARKEAADGAESMPELGTPGTAEPSVPGGPGPQEPAVPGMNGGIAETTKPRQMPGDASGMDPTMAPGMGMDGIDPGLNGGDIEQGADDLPPSDDAARTAKISAIASEVRKYNPTLSLGQCRKVAHRVYDQYLVKHAEDMSPLLFGDRGGVPDGPATHKVKTWAPEDLKPGGGEDSSGSGGGGGMPNIPKMPTKLPKIPGMGGAGMGEAAAGAGAVAELGEAAQLLPLLAL